MTKHNPVTFLSASGEVITNDPILKAQQLLGIETPSDNDEDLGDDYDSLDGKALKALATERGVDISGLKKVGEVREALRAADASEDTEPEDEQSGDSTDDSDD